MAVRKRTRNGKTIYSWRATVPFREADGRLSHREVERGLGAVTLAEAREKARLLEREVHDKASRLPEAPKGAFIFADAARTYLESGGERRFLAPIVEAIGAMPVDEIDQDVVNRIAREIYPGRTPGTINRQLFTPILAVLGMPANAKRCPPPLLTRPRGHDKAPALEIPDEAWFDAIMPVMSPKLRALVTCLTLHGRRVSDYIKRTPADVDTVHWILSIPDTKTRVPFEVRLADAAIDAIKDMWLEQQREDAERALKGKPPLKRRWLFGTALRSNIARDLRAAAKKAGVRYFSTHPIGRHSFATRLLREGKSLKFVKDAGGWATIKMVADRYGHLEKREVDEEVNEIASRWAKRRAPGKVVALKAVK
jgi:integrase